MKLFTIILSAAALLFGSLVNAQPAGGRIAVRFATPVMAGETEIPAGQCDIQVLRGASDSIVLVVRPESGPAVSVLANRWSGSHNEIEGEASVVLDRRGDTYHLSRIVFPDNSGYQLIE
jgi:hypothetical protein